MLNLFDAVLEDILIVWLIEVKLDGMKIRDVT